MNNLLRRAAVWIVFNVRCGPLAPWLLGYGLGAKSIRRVK